MEVLFGIQPEPRVARIDGVKHCVQIECKAKINMLANQQTSEKHSGRFPGFSNFVGLIQQNWQALDKEWTEFVQRRSGTIPSRSGLVRATNTRGLLFEEA